LPSFEANFSEGKVINEELNNELKMKVDLFKKAI
jgi:hypothetical protein